MIERYTSVDLAKIVRQPQRFNPDAIDYTVATEPLTPKARRIVCYIGETELFTKDYILDAQAWRTGMSPGIVEDFMWTRWKPEELNHAEGVHRCLGADALLQDQPMDTLVWHSEQERSQISLRAERLEVLVKRFAIARTMQASHGILRLARQKNFDTNLTGIIEVLHMAIGGVNELVANRAWRACADYANSPVFDQMAPLASADERKHATFYFGYALKRSQDHAFVRKVVAELLARSYTPVGVGTGYHQPETFGFVATELATTKRGDTLTDDVDQTVNELLGTEGRTVIADAVRKCQDLYELTAA